MKMHTIVIKLNDTACRPFDKDDIVAIDGFKYLGKEVKEIIIDQLNKLCYLE